MLDVSELLEMMRASCGEDEALRRTVGEGDVAFVLEHCDTNGDGKLARDEVLPMLAICPLICPLWCWRSHQQML